MLIEFMEIFFALIKVKYLSLGLVSGSPNHNISGIPNCPEKENH